MPHFARYNRVALSVVPITDPSENQESWLNISSFVRVSNARSETKLPKETERLFNACDKLRLTNMAINWMGVEHTLKMWQEPLKCGNIGSNISKYQIDLKPQLYLPTWMTYTHSRFLYEYYLVYQMCYSICNNSQSGRRPHTVVIRTDLSMCKNLISHKICCILIFIFMWNLFSQNFFIIGPLFNIDPIPSDMKYFEGFRNSFQENRWTLVLQVLKGYNSFCRKGSLFGSPHIAVLPGIT